MHSCRGVLGRAHLGFAAAGSRWPPGPHMPPEAGQSRAAHLHGDRALRLGQEALDQDIWRQIWRAHLRVPETHTLPLSAHSGGADITKGPEALRAPGHCIVGQCCSGQERCISNILLKPLNAKPPMAVGEVKQRPLRCMHVSVTELCKCFHCCHMLSLLPQVCVNCLHREEQHNVAPGIKCVCSLHRPGCT